MAGAALGGGFFVLDWAPAFWIARVEAKSKTAAAEIKVRAELELKICFGAMSYPLGKNACGYYCGCMSLTLSSTKVIFMLG